MQYYRNFNLTNYNSFHVNSIAIEAWFPETVKELGTLINKLKNNKYYVLSDGTNVLLNRTIDRIVCLRKIEKSFIILSKDKILVSGSYPTNAFINKIIQMKLSGLEGLIGIPGLLGGAIVMNAGSGEYNISDCLVGCEVLNQNAKIIFKSKEQLQFGRRYSTLQDTKEILISAIFKLKNEEPNKKVISKARNYRKNFPKGYTAGGIFSNWYNLKPYEKIIRTIKSPNLTISKQLNVIISNGKATSKEILNFISQIKTIVKEPLKLEIKLLGLKNE